MGTIEIGQKFEFIEPAHLDGGVIKKGTRVRVGLVSKELLGSYVTVVVLEPNAPEILTMPRHVLTLHSIALPQGKRG